MYTFLNNWRFYLDDDTSLFTVNAFTHLSKSTSAIQGKKNVHNRSWGFFFIFFAYVVGVAYGLSEHHRIWKPHLPRFICRLTLRLFPLTLRCLEFWEENEHQPPVWRTDCIWGMCAGNVGESKGFQVYGPWPWAMRNSEAPAELIPPVNCVPFIYNQTSLCPRLPLHPPSNMLLLLPAVARRSLYWTRATWVWSSLNWAACYYFSDSGKQGIWGLNDGKHWSHYRYAVVGVSFGRLPGARDVSN